MSVVILQSAPPNPPAWLERCMASVQRWALERGYGCKRCADGLFNLLPADLGHLETLHKTDVCRLLWLEKTLEHHERAVWIDADVLIWGPLELPDAPFAPARELWWEEGEAEAHRTNNAILSMTRAGLPDLERVLTCTLERAKEPLGKLSLATDLLSDLQRTECWTRVEGLGMFGPRRMAALATDDTRALERYMERFGPTHAANLCLSEALDEDTMGGAMDTLEHSPPPCSSPYTFVITAYHGDLHLAVRLLWQLIHFHADSTRVLIVDGQPLPEQMRALEGLAHQVMTTPRLGSQDRATAWLERVLRVGLGYGTGPLLVKLDPDACLLRPLRTYPVGADLMGSGLPGGSVQGGCYAIRRSAARAILGSGVLEREELQLLNGASANVFWEDEQITRAARALGLTLADWPEVCSRFKPPVSVRELAGFGEKYSVVHPIKS